MTVSGRNPNAGKFGDRCYRTACQRPNSATYWNASTREHYCQSCAQDINKWSRIDVGFDICVQGSSKSSYAELEERATKAKAQAGG